ncbi:MAG: TorF family putative porin [Pontiellaceae bacterium]
MKKVIATTMAAFLVAQVASAISATVDIASAYVFRGATFNDGIVIQPGVEGEVAGYTVGVWANIDIDDAGNDDQVSEIDLYIGKDLGSVAGWDLSAGYCEYTYPGVAGNGESELSLSASGAISGFDVSLAAYANIAEESTPNFYEASTGGSTSIAGLALDYGISLGYSADEEVGGAEAETGVGYVAYSLSYDTAGGTISATYIDGRDDDIVEVDESLVFAYGISL